VTREQRIVETFVELADTMVAEFDVVEFLHRLADRCAELLDCAEAGILLADAAGALRVMASWSERAEALELLQSQNAVEAQVLANRPRGQAEAKLHGGMAGAHELLRGSSRPRRTARPAVASDVSEPGSSEDARAGDPVVGASAGALPARDDASEGH